MASRRPFGPLTVVRFAVNLDHQPVADEEVDSTHAWNFYLGLHPDPDTGHAVAEQ